MKVMKNLQDYALLVEKKKKEIVSIPVIVDEHKSNKPGCTCSPISADRQFSSSFAIQNSLKKNNYI